MKFFIFICFGCVLAFINLFCSLFIDGDKSCKLQDIQITSVIYIVSTTIHLVWFKIYADMITKCPEVKNRARLIVSLMSFLGEASLIERGFKTLKFDECGDKLFSSITDSVLVINVSFHFLTIVGLGIGGIPYSIYKFKNRGEVKDLQSPIMESSITEDIRFFEKESII